MTHSRTFSRALRQLHAMTWGRDWFTAFLCPLWLARVITLVLVLPHSIKKTLYKNVHEWITKYVAIYASIAGCEMLLNGSDPLKRLFRVSNALVVLLKQTHTQFMTKSAKDIPYWRPNWPRAIPSISDQNCSKTIPFGTTYSPCKEVPPPASKHILRDVTLGIRDIWAGV